MPVTILKEHSLLLPAGNTATRPGSPVTGMTRYNTTTAAIEYYNGTSWIGIGLLDGASSGTAAPSASYIKTITGTSTSGVYWIKNSSMPFATQVYCDMSYDGGGYMLLAYGFVGSTADSSSNWNIPNLNHDGTSWPYNPTSRAGGHGVLPGSTGQRTALLIAKTCSTFLMAAGGNPNTGGVNEYSFIYTFPIPSPSVLTFNNHALGNNGGMNIATVTVTALKGQSGTYTRYTLDQSLGATWGDSYPSGYGAIANSNPNNGTWDAGPFFPSFHSGARASGSNGNQNAVPVNSSPDIGVNGFQTGSRSYTYRGWYDATGNGNTGQTSLWVR